MNAGSTCDAYKGTLHWKIGRVTVDRVLEVQFRLPPERILPNANARTLAPHAGWLKPHFVSDDDQFFFAFQGFLLKSGNQTIVVDTCLGEDERFIGGSRFLRRLGRLGASRADVDVVLCTHLHFDHVGWNTMQVDGRWVPTFPNARYLFARVEYEHWRAELDEGRGDEHVRLFEDAVQPIVDAGLCELVELDHAITDEVRFLPTPGHTPGHVAVVIESEGESALITGDLAHHPVQWAELDWPMPADSDTPLAAQTRRALLSRYADTPTLIIGSHFAAPCAGYLRKQADGHVFLAEQR